MNDKEKNIKYRIYNLFGLLFIFICLLSCKAKEKIVEVPVEIPKIKTEIKYIDKLQHDSIYLKDSIFIYQKGDTIFNNKILYQYKYKYLRDTININKIDTIYKPIKITETIVKNELNSIQKTLVYIGLFALIFVIIWIYRQFKK